MGDVKKPFRRLFRGKADQSRLSTGISVRTGAPAPSSPSNDEIVPSAKVQFDNLWQLAEEKLSNDKTKRKYFLAYQEALQLTSPSADGRRHELCEMLGVKTRELETQNEKWKLHIGERTVDMQSLLEGVVKTIECANHLIGEAASSSTPAAVACVGANVFLLVREVHHLLDLWRGFRCITTGYKIGLRKTSASVTWLFYYHFSMLEFKLTPTAVAEAYC